MKEGNNLEISKTKLVRSAFIFAFCYLLLLALIVVMIIVNDLDGWVNFFRTSYTELVTLCACSLLLFSIIYYYYYIEHREFLVKARNIFLVFSIMLLCIALCYVFGRFVNIYLRPTALLALLCVILFNRRQAMMLNFVFSVLLFVIDVFTNNFGGGVVRDVYFSLMLSFGCGTIAVFVGGNLKTRAKLLLTACAIALPTMVIVLLLEIPVAARDWAYIFTQVGCSVGGCFISAMLAFVLLPLFEFPFKRLTVFRLRELTSTSAPILVRLREEAPGTFNHSLVVAQLCEACALAIGENQELARVAAYYHDVGKLKQPECFTENQIDYNLHDELTPELSADIIRSHAKDGYDLLTDAHMPPVIADVAREHHGTLPIKFFYNKAMKLSGGEANVKAYSYLGPKPSSKIAAIVMIADAAEASVRAMRDRSPEHVEKSVRTIIEERLDLDQFSDCNITLRDLTVIRITLVETLSGVHHHRVEYPAMRFTREDTANE